MTHNAFLFTIIMLNENKYLIFIIIMSIKILYITNTNFCFSILKSSDRTTEMLLSKHKKPLLNDCTQLNYKMNNCVLQHRWKIN